jgi:GNAT superfamily N-acetyltransferase
MNKKDDVRIRRAKPSDLNSMLDLLRLLFSIEDDFIFDAKKQYRGLAMLLEHETAVVLVAESENRVFGMCTGQLVVSTAEGGYSLLVEDVVVETALRGQGVGRSLLEKLKEWAMGYNKVTRLQLLADRSNNEGLAFYKRTDWRRTNLICLRKTIRSGN